MSQFRMPILELLELPKHLVVGGVRDLGPVF
jgi:hypothetical protein